MQKSFVVTLLALVLVGSACAGGTTAPSSGPSTATPPGSAAASPKGPLMAATPKDCPAPAGDVNITMWSSTEAQGNAVEKAMVAEYMAANPNVHITYTGGLDSNDSNTKFLAAASSGGGPTIVGTNMAQVRVLYDNKLISPAIPTAMCGNKQQDLIDRYVSGTINSYIFDGNVYGLPTQQNSWSFFVNNRKFTQAGLNLATDVPKTWDQVAALQSKLKKVDANGRITQKGFEFRTAAIQWYINMTTDLMWQLQGEFFDAAGNPVWNSDKGVQVLKIWKANIVDPKVTTNVGNSPYNDFANEQDVMSYGGPNAVAFIESLNPAMKGNITVAPMPKAGAGPNFLYGYPAVVNTNATDAQKAAAWNYLNYMYSDPNRWFKNTGLLQPLKGWYELPAAKDFNGLPVFISDMTNARALVATTHYSQLQDAWKNAIDRVILQNQDPKASLDQSIKEYNTAIGK